MLRPQAAAAQLLAPALFAAPMFAWAAFSLPASTLGPLALALIAAFVAAESARAAWFSAQKLSDGLGQAMRVGAARLRTLSRGLSLRIKFALLMGLMACAWSVTIIALVASEAGEVAVVAAVAGLTATIGWTFSSYITARNTQRQNTITLLLNMRHSEIYSRHFNNAYLLTLNAALRDDHAHWYKLDLQVKWRNGDTMCDPTEAPQAAITVRSAYQSVIYVLNYFEFIAAGVRSGALDGGIVRETVLAHFHWLHTSFAAWIASERRHSSGPYENLIWLCERFPARAGA
ncbi:MAG: DUF4760 domain-containing protein [Hyphomonadaceae bacterium]